MASGATWIGPVLFHALPQGSGQFLSFFQLRNVGWWRRGRRAQEVLQNPFAALYRRGTRGIRSHREDAGLSEDATPLIACQMNFLKLIAADAVDAVMPSQTLVQKREICVEEIE